MRNAEELTVAMKAFVKRIIKGSVTFRGQSRREVSGAQGSKTLVSDDQGSKSFSDKSRSSVSDAQE